jgi:hypothetical protein
LPFPSVEAAYNFYQGTMSTRLEPIES